MLGFVSGDLKLRSADSDGLSNDVIRTVASLDLGNSPFEGHAPSVGARGQIAVRQRLIHFRIRVRELVEVVVDPPKTRLVSST